MDNNVDRIYAEIGRYTPVSWEKIPDLGLYMDQVITFITRVYEPLYGDSTKSYLSAPMINNYVKNKLIPRPTGKKYSRTQIALLIMIISLKRVCTMEDIRSMLTVREEEDVRALYALFCERQQKSISDMMNTRSALSAAMDLAVYASSYRAGCECLLYAPQEMEAEPEEE